MSDTLHRIVELIGEATDMAAADISPEMRFDALPDWTSFASLRLLAGIEAELEIRLDLRRYLANTTVADLVDMVSAELASPRT